MAWVLVAHIAARSLDGQGVITPDIDTTGANLIVIPTAQTTFLTPPPKSPGDSKGNIYTLVQPYNGPLAGIQFWVCRNPVVGTGHTFNIPPGTILFPSLGVTAWSGADTSSAFDVQSGAATFNPALASPGSIVPTQNGDLILTATVANLGAPASVAGFTPIDLLASTSQGLGIGVAYAVQNPAAPINPTWNGTGLQASAIVAFKGATVPPPPTPLVALSLDSVVSIPGGTVTLTLSIASTGGC